MDALTAGLRDLLVAEGASPELALETACEEAPKYRKRIKRERDENLAQQLLPLGRHKAAERIGCSPNHVYKLVQRATKVLSKPAPADDVAA